MRPVPTQPGRCRRHTLPPYRRAHESPLLRYTGATVTTRSNRDDSQKKRRPTASRPASKTRGSKKAVARPRRRIVQEPVPAAAVPEAPPDLAVSEEPQPELFPLPVSAVESTFAARVPPPEPERPRPPGRRAIFLDVENTSRAQHLAHVIDHLGVDPWDRRTELVAVANWRVVGHEAARLLAARGAHLVHSAPSTGVRDWSDLRIAVAAGIWLASARPGDLIEIVSDDRAFDAVGDVAASLGIEFRRLSYRRLREDGAGPAVETESVPAASSAASSAAPSRRRRRRRGRGPGGPTPSSAPERRHADTREGARPSGSAAAPGSRTAGGRRRPVTAQAPRPPVDASHTTAPHDELVSVVRGLVESSPKRSVSIDAVANALKSRGFLRSPGSPRLVTRLRRIREILVSASGIITLAEDGAAPGNGPLPEPTPRKAEPQVGPEPMDDEVDDDRQPDFLAGRPGDRERPEVDGNRADADGNRAEPSPPGAAPVRGRRRRRRRWRGGPRQPASGSPPPA